MAKIKNVSGEDRRVRTPNGPLVLAGATLEVDASEVYGFTQQEIWEPADAEAKKAHAEAHAAYEKALAADLATLSPDAEDEAATADEAVTEPTTTDKTSKEK